MVTVIPHTSWTSTEHAEVDSGNTKLNVFWGGLKSFFFFRWWGGQMQLFDRPCSKCGCYADFVWFLMLTNRHIRVCASSEGNQCIHVDRLKMASRPQATRRGWLGSECCTIQTLNIPLSGCVVTFICNLFSATCSHSMVVSSFILFNICDILILQRTLYIYKQCLLQINDMQMNKTGVVDRKRYTSSHIQTAVNHGKWPPLAVKRFKAESNNANLACAARITRFGCWLCSCVVPFIYSLYFEVRPVLLFPILSWWSQAGGLRVFGPLSSRCVRNA